MANTNYHSRYIGRNIYETPWKGEEKHQNHNIQIGGVHYVNFAGVSCEPPCWHPFFKCIKWASDHQRIAMRLCRPVFPCPDDFPVWNSKLCEFRRKMLDLKLHRSPSSSSSPFCPSFHDFRSWNIGGDHSCAAWCREVFCQPPEWLLFVLTCVNPLEIPRKKRDPKP